jgi:flagellar biosynthesis GTPase FlhF
MSEIQLIAETPRAGKWNHCFIVAPTGDLSGEAIQEVVKAARRSAQGEDYLAVSVEAAQMLSGRTGREILVLTGIEVNRLSDTQRQQVMVQLEQRLADLATLVTEKVDWEQEGKGGLVKRVELVDWENDFSNLPPARKRRLSQSERKRRTNQLIWAGSVIGILLVGIAIWSLKNPDNTSRQPPKTELPQVTIDTTKQEKEAKQKQAEEDAKQRKQAEEDAKQRKQAAEDAKQRKQAEEDAKQRKQAAEDAKQRKQAAEDARRKQREAAEQKRRKSIEEFQAKVSTVKCNYLPAYQDSEKRKNCVSSICDDRTGVLNNGVLNHLKFYKKGDALDPTLKHWCSLKEEISKVTDKNLNCLSNWKDIQPVRDFIKQLSTQLDKEILCPKN